MKGLGVSNDFLPFGVRCGVRFGVGTALCDKDLSEGVCRCGRPGR